MTPLATTVDEEGVLFDNFRIVDKGRFQEAELHRLLTDHPYPARNPHQNIADLKAQIAANEKGVAELRKMVAHFGLDVVEAYMGHVQDNAGQRAPALSRWNDKFGSMDQGAWTRDHVDRATEARRLLGDQATNNFNGPSAHAPPPLCFRVVNSIP
jgi:N-methylhydantoinase B/oxoprolinase/acetone carboxylase alpha subunit